MRRRIIASDLLNRPRRARPPPLRWWRPSGRSATSTNSGRWTPSRPARAASARKVSRCSRTTLRRTPRSVARGSYVAATVAISRRTPKAASGEFRECDTQSASRRPRRPRLRTCIDPWTSSRETIRATLQRSDRWKCLPRRVGETGIENVARFLVVVVGQQLHRSLEVGEENGYVLAFALQSAAPHSPDNFCAGAFGAPHVAPTAERRARTPRGALRREVLVLAQRTFHAEPLVLKTT